MITPNGRYLGRRPDGADPRDLRFAAVHAARVDLPARVSLRKQLPPAFDQGTIGSCGPQSGCAMMVHQFPELRELFSRNQVYYSVRDMQGDVFTDSGVETRNVLKVLTKVGAAYERSWSYGKDTLFKKPPAPVLVEASQHRLESYSRLQTEDDYLGCLADGYTFVLGFTCFESFDGDVIARTGVMSMPDPKREKEIGGHDVLVVGYNTNFKKSDVFKKSEIDPALVEDTMLEIRNSWGTGWGDHGHFWMPLSYALNASTGGDAWTGRRYAPVQVRGVMSLLSTSQGPVLSAAQLRAGASAARGFADDSGYGTFISDDQCRQIASVVGQAVITTK